MIDGTAALIGMITLEDLTILAGEPQLPSGLVNAADIMRPPIALGERDSLRTAYELLVSSGLRELPVVDAERRMVALVNEVAIAHAYLRARRRGTSGLRSVSATAGPATPPGAPA